MDKKALNLFMVEKLTKNPNEKFAMTDREIATPESSRFPMCPMKMLVNELMP